MSGSSGSMVKPVASMVAKTPPVRGLVVHWPPHSTIFADVPRRPGRHALHQRVRRGDRGVGGPAGEDDLGAGLEGGDDRLVAHQPHDVGAALQRLGVQLAHRRQRVDPAGVERLLEVARRPARCRSARPGGRAPPRPSPGRRCRRPSRRRESVPLVPHDPTMSGMPARAAALSSACAGRARPGARWSWGWQSPGSGGRSRSSRRRWRSRRPRARYRARPSSPRTRRRASRSGPGCSRTSRHCSRCSLISAGIGKRPSGPRRCRAGR